MKQPCTDQFWFRALWAAFLVIGLGYFLLVGYWMFYPYRVLDLERPIEIVNLDKKVKAGDYLCYRLKYTKHMDVQGILTRKLVNDYVIDLRPSRVSRGEGVDADYVFIKIPNFAPAGKYHLVWSTVYKVNPMREITVCAKSEEFEVVK
jgi:hypothetical protein